MKKAAWITMTVLALLVAGYTAAVLFVSGFGPPFIAERRAEMPLAVIAHLAGGLWAMAVGPWQLHQGLRESALGRHRWLGRSYVVAVLLGGAGALAMAPRAQTGLVAQSGFGLLGLAWLAGTLLAFVMIRRGDQEAHRRWMTRSYALTLAAVMLRLYIPAAVSAGIAFERAYPVIAWMCWVPNLLVAEWLNARRAGRVTAAA